MGNPHYLSKFEVAAIRQIARRVHGALDLSTLMRSRKNRYL